MFETSSKTMPMCKIPYAKLLYIRWQIDLFYAQAHMAPLNTDNRTS
jgi:hypothetical protein